MQLNHVYLISEIENWQAFGMTSGYMGWLDSRDVQGKIAVYFLRNDYPKNFFNLIRCTIRSESTFRSEIRKCNDPFENMSRTGGGAALPRRVGDDSSDDDD